MVHDLPDAGIITGAQGAEQDVVLPGAAKHFIRESFYRIERPLPVGPVDHPRLTEAAAPDAAPLQFDRHAVLRHGEEGNQGLFRIRRLFGIVQIRSHLPTYTGRDRRILRRRCIFVSIQIRGCLPAHTGRDRRILRRRCIFISARICGRLLFFRIKRNGTSVPDAVLRARFAMAVVFRPEGFDRPVLCISNFVKRRNVDSGNLRRRPKKGLPVPSAFVRRSSMESLPVVSGFVRRPTMEGLPVVSGFV